MRANHPNSSTARASTFQQLRGEEAGFDSSKPVMVNSLKFALSFRRLIVNFSTSSLLLLDAFSKKLLRDSLRPAG